MGEIRPKTCKGVGITWSAWIVGFSAQCPEQKVLCEERPTHAARTCHESCGSQLWPDTARVLRFSEFKPIDGFTDGPPADMTALHSAGLMKSSKCMIGGSSLMNLAPG